MDVETGTLKSMGVPGGRRPDTTTARHSPDCVKTCDIHAFYHPRGNSIIILRRIDGRDTIHLDGHTLTLMGIIGGTALTLNIPLGYLRAGQRKYSLPWFIYIHLSIPLIAYLRIANHVTSWLIPFFIFCAVVGQIVGGRVRRQAGKGH